MTNAQEIERLEKRIVELEGRLTAVLEAMIAAQGLTVDAVALLAVQDRAQVENLLRMRRLAHQNSGSGAVTAAMLERFDLALEIADRLKTSGPPRPQ